MGGASRGRDSFAVSSTRIDEGGPSEMLHAAIDIHKKVFQAAVLDAESGQLVQERLPASREALADWATRWAGKLEAVALEATTGWRWVWRELSARGFEVRLCDPGQAQALRGSKRRPKTDRLDAAWLARLLAKEMLPTCWLPPEDIQYLRDRTRLRRALAEDRTRFAQRLHALLTHEGVSESAETRRRGKLSKQGSPELRSALVEAAHHARQQRSPDYSLYLAGKQRSGSKRAALTVARKIARRAYHVLAELEQAA